MDSLKKYFAVANIKVISSSNIDSIKIKFSDNNEKIINEENDNIKIWKEIISLANELTDKTLYTELIVLHEAECPLWIENDKVW